MKLVITSHKFDVFVWPKKKKFKSRCRGAHGSKQFNNRIHKEEINNNNNNRFAIIVRRKIIYGTIQLYRGEREKVGERY